jgi:hypothetical protein
MPADYEGYHWEAIPARWWRSHTRGMQCRAGAVPGRSRCPAIAVMELNRSVRSREAWWAYCADHANGRWLEDGVVLEWRLRSDEEVPDASAS